jgi:hypothetical protein
MRSIVIGAIQRNRFNPLGLTAQPQRVRRLPAYIYLSPRGTYAKTQAVAYQDAETFGSSSGLGQKS